MLIRRLTAEDAASFREIRVEMCRNHPEAFGQTPEEVLSMPEDKFLEWTSPRDTFPEKFVLAAFESDEKSKGECIIGTVGFFRDELEKEKHRGTIWCVYVKPEVRGQGLSKKLMQRVIDEVRKIVGMEILTLTVAITQTSARTLYTSLGFFTTGHNPHGYKLPDGRRIDTEEMMLWL